MPASTLAELYAAACAPITRADIAPRTLEILPLAPIAASEPTSPPCVPAAAPEPRSSNTRQRLIKLAAALALFLTVRISWLLLAHGVICLWWLLRPTRFHGAEQ